MIELELSLTYSPSDLMLSKLAIVGFFNLACNLLLIVVINFFAEPIVLIELLKYWAVPYLFVVTVCLFLSIRLRAVFATPISIAILFTLGLSIAQLETVYHAIPDLLFIVMFFCAMAAIGLEVKMIKRELTMNLTINNLSKKYGKHIALDGISCQFTSGVYGILGANGSGKTTLMRMLATVTSPTAGTIQLNENSIFELGDDYRDLIGYLPQHIGLYKSFSAEKFLHYIAALKGLDKTYAALKIEELLELVNLTHVRKKKVGSFPAA